MSRYNKVEWNSFAFISLICFLLSSSSAILSFVSRKAGAPFLYGVMSVILALWSLGLFFCLSADNADDALFWARVANYTVVFLPVLIFHFAVNFVDKNHSLQRIVFLYYTITGLYLGAIFSSPDSFLYNPTYRLDQFWFPTGGTLFYFFPVLFTLVVAHAIHILCLSRSGSDRAQKLKIDYLLSTIIIGLLGGGLSISLEFGIDIPPYGILSVALMVVISTYAVLKHELLEFPETFSIVAARCMTYICVFAFMVLVLEFATQISSLALTSTQVLFVGLATVLAAEIYSAIKGKIQYLSNRFLIKQRVEHDNKFRTLVFRLEQATNFEAMLPLLRDYLEAQSYIYHYAWYLDQNLLEYSLKKQSTADLDADESSELVYQRILFSLNDGRRHDRLPSIMRLGGVDDALELESTRQVVELMSSEQLDAAYAWVEKVPGREMLGLPLIANNHLRGMLLVVVNQSEMNRNQQSSLQSLTTKLAQLVERVEFYRKQSQMEQQFLLEKMKSLQTLAGNIAHEMKVPLSQLTQFVEFVDMIKSSEQGIAASIDLNLHSKQAKAALKRSSQAMELTLGLLKNDPIDVSRFHLLSVQNVVNKALAEYVFLPGEREFVETDFRHNFILKGEEKLLQFAVFNLLKALLSQSTGNPSFHLQISSEVGERNNALVFCCRGMSVSPQVVPQMLESHFCSSPSKGFSLGLAYCQRVMRAFGGEIQWESEKQGYVEFRLVFQPVADSAVETTVGAAVDTTGGTTIEASIGTTQKCNLIAS